MDSSKKHALDQLTNKFKKEGNFHEWFNQAFEKHRVDNPLSEGYGEWLKSDEGFVQPAQENVTIANMNAAFEQQKRQQQSMIIYGGGIQSMVATAGGIGSSLSGQFESNAQ